MKNTIIILLIVFTACQKEYNAPIPNIKWDLFESSTAIPLNHSSVKSIEGVYKVINGQEDFGDEVVVKSSFIKENADTVYKISVFCRTDISFFICDGKHIDSTILLYGYWRKMINTETGTVRFTIKSYRGANQILSTTPVIAKDSILIEGLFGESENIPDRGIMLSFDRPLMRNDSFQILAHRGGGRTADKLNVSENSIEIIKRSSQFGSTGVEIDIRLTSDGIPILYHDNTLNLRLIKPNGLTGDIENYSYAQLNGLVRLINGEKIPTLREALDAVIYNTSLEFVWLDTKYSGSLQVIRSIQEEYIQKALLAGRQLKIFIGLPTVEQKDNFLNLANYSLIPSVCELSIDETRTVNALIWAPRWTLGIQSVEVAKMHSEGRKCIAWTMDVPEYIEQFINQGDFDGILTNYPSIVAYYEYAY